MPPLASEDAHWFAQRLQPYEPMLRAWLRRLFPRGCEIDDVVQEAYFRVLRARERRPLDAPKAFLFATARNVALDHFRRSRAIPPQALVQIEAESVMDTGEGGPEALAHTQALDLMHEAIQALPDRCREIFALRKLHGLSQREIAERLHISERTVSAQLTIGLHKCIGYVAHFRRQEERFCR